MKIANWRPSTSGGARKGSFDLTMPSGMTLIGCSLVDGEKGTFIGLPQRNYVKDGVTKYAATVSIEDRDVREKFNLAVIAALEKEGFIS